MIHFTGQEIRRWSAAGPGADRERVIGHLAACARCAALYAEAIRTRGLPAGAGADIDDAGEFATVGYAVPARGTPVAAFPARRRRAMLSLAAAAALAAAIAVPYALRARTRPATDGIVVRGGSIQLLSPSGSVDPGIEFAWSSPVTPTAFRVDIGDGRGIAYSETTSEARLRLKPDAWKTLSAGIDYWWTVTALDRAGQPVATSGRQAFRIRPAR